MRLFVSGSSSRQAKARSWHLPVAVHCCDWLIVTTNIFDRFCVYLAARHHNPLVDAALPCHRGDERQSTLRWQEEPKSYSKQRVAKRWMSFYSFSCIAVWVGQSYTALNLIQEYDVLYTHIVKPKTEQHPVTNSWTLKLIHHLARSLSTESSSGETTGDGKNE